VEDHQMHSEWFYIPDETIDAIKETKAAGGRVVSLGTTVARTLEYYGKTGKTSGEDDIFIYPGFEFTVIDALLTNFHAPKSTVLMMVAAFAGWEHLHAAYDHCVEAGYNFLSYGDSMLIC
jgi:S-adenosylmethionine:tRNA ribosyltransferase-isomerase